ncbi:MAG: 16S rRNA (uracil(1498)-N(3))-methyltransferase [Treponema sp.]|nr:16S rRNA (uracil(1498)-N(3))-methyltransferase [Treponema sp.]
MIRVTGKDFHYLVRVRRFGPGAVFKALLPGGGEIPVRVRSVESAALTGECLSGGGTGDFDETPPLRLPPEESSPAAENTCVLPPLLLFQALPKGSKMDLIVRQAAEGAISEIVPFISEYTIRKIKASPEESRSTAGQADLCAGAAEPGRTGRWRRIVKEARQQSGSLTATTVEEPCTLGALFARWERIRQEHPRALGLFLHQDPLEKGTFHEYLSRDPELVAIAVGPEGGFSPAETRRFLEADFKPLIMGNTILRTETAALYAAAVVRIILLERASWIHKPF